MLTGNREFNESYENYKNLILRTAYTYSGNREAAEDEYLEDELKRKRYVLHKKISEEMYKKNPRWYEAMVLVYYMDMPQVKVAELMGVNLRTLHSLLHRAKNWIKKNYKVEYEEMNRED